MKKKRVKSAVIIAAVVAVLALVVAAGIYFAPYIISGRLIAAVRSQDYAKMEAASCGVLSKRFEGKTAYAYAAEAENAALTELLRDQKVSRTQYEVVRGTSFCKFQKNTCKIRPNMVYYW